jgi:enoyl-[acyl-carrier protein] reductase I
MGVAKAALEASVRYLAYDLGPKKIRVNAISAGPVKTLAASGISGFRDKLKYAEEHSALKENIHQDNVADMSLFLGSSLSSHVTGQVLYVDSGLSIVGV